MVVDVGVVQLLVNYYRRTVWSCYKSCGGMYLA